ncbi:MAG: Major Facilitator Superfamily protein [Candidatus Accumulibacter phosphatis]|uniref:Major Facilitator Superfamily protein n=1 Tax=Candidatus Accumulibacter phosphatis TaxID=327160 RepID=A0A080MAW6_9PROT|nr:organoarsenical effux MFS transporter ArsJ [Accumulibacter sp.]KFB74289.1 MAG: Major Facilitator Superfamily protein [Candidatus Accumulibacter phosphatis]MBL8407075.1 organoarsenical effux MFS transporter ArsJ [Accumulibacter sp.]
MNDPSATRSPAARAGLRNYILVTAAYWSDTVTDGATRMLVLFYFYSLGYTPLAVASLFIFYEVFGILTNLFGGYIGARFGLKTTLFIGLGTQLVALSMLAFAPQGWLVVVYVMVSQALSGIAKDMTKMSSKSAVKLIVPEGASATLYRWVSILTGSKNALKGVGFFLGGLLLTLLDFQTALKLLVALVGSTLILAALLMRGGLGQANKKAKFGQMFSRNGAVNKLAAARIFLFGARDVWFVVGLPVFLSSVLGWTFWQSGGFLAVWVIGYGIVQAATPGLLRSRVEEQHEPDGRTATILAFVLAVLPAGIALGLSTGLAPSTVVVTGLILFGAVFALNSAVHSYLILAYTDSDKVAMSVGFYYMANASGRLAGTVLSGALYQWGLQSGPSNGLIACLWASTVFVVLAGLLSLLLPRHIGPRSKPIKLDDLGE